MERVKGVEDLNICIIGTQGIVGAPLHRAGRWALAGSGEVDLVPARLFSS